MTTREGPLVTVAGVDEVIRAIETFDLQAPWSEVAPDLRLTLPRRRPMPPGAEDLPAREFPPGIRAGLGLDIGPAMLFISEKQLEGWGVTLDRAFEQALSNVRTRVATRRQFALVHERIAGVPTIAFQSREGWASSLLLLPDELARVLGSRSGLVLAPMRDVIICLPLDAGPAFARDLLDRFAEADMNALDLPVFALVDGRLARTASLPEPRRDNALQH